VLWQMTSDPSPVARCEEWACLLDALKTAAFPAFTRESLGQAVLAAPAAIARWIALRAPALGTKPTLSLLVVGAETIDAADEGRWYQWLAMLLDAKQRVAVTLVGPELDIAFVSAARAHAPAVVARSCRMTLDDFLARENAGEFDLAVIFHPGFQKHRSWLGSSGLASLVRAGVEVIASSFEADEYEMDRWVLEAYGYGVDEPLINPFFLELGDEHTTVRWGRALWAIQSAPRPDYRVDEARLAALDTLTRMVMHSMTRQSVPTPPYGSAVELQSGSGTSMRVVHIFDNSFVDPASGAVSRLDANGELKQTGAIALTELAAYPAAGREIERAIWAAAIKERYLLPSGEDTVPRQSGAELAAGMLSAMRGRAARLFQ
jgi:hypothetical protein